MGMCKLPSCWITQSETVSTKSQVNYGQAKTESVTPSTQSVETTGPVGSAAADKELPNLF